MSIITQEMRKLTHDLQVQKANTAVSFKRRKEKQDKFSKLRIAQNPVELLKILARCTVTLKLRCAINQQIILSNLSGKMKWNWVQWAFYHKNCIILDSQDSRCNFLFYLFFLSGECKCEDMWSGCIMGDMG